MIRTTLLLATLVGCGLVWTRDRVTTADLRQQLDTAQQENSELASLRNERERLQNLQREPKERASPPIAQSVREAPTQPTPTRDLELGEWLNPNEWKDRSLETPMAMLETMLWAAAGGDVKRLTAMLSLDADVRARAGVLLERLSGEARAPYPNAEHMIAAFSIKAIPLGGAQLLWRHDAGPKDVTVAIRLRAPGVSQDKSVMLNLRHDHNGWRIVVPMEAVSRINRELALVF